MPAPAAGRAGKQCLTIAKGTGGGEESGGGQGCRGPDARTPQLEVVT